MKLKISQRQAELLIDALTDSYTRLENLLKDSADYQDRQTQTYFKSKLERMEYLQNYIINVLQQEKELYKYL